MTHFEKLQSQKILASYGISFEKSEKNDFQDLENFDLEKGRGKTATVGEVREFSGKKFMKHSDGWVELKDGKAHRFHPKERGSKPVPASEEHHSHVGKHSEKKDVKDNEYNEVEVKWKDVVRRNGNILEAKIGDDKIAIVAEHYARGKTQYWATVNGSNPKRSGPGGMGKFVDNEDYQDQTPNKTAIEDLKRKIIAYVLEKQKKEKEESNLKTPSTFTEHILDFGKKNPGSKLHEAESYAKKKMSEVDNKSSDKKEKK